jgi:hypothetical protein
VYCSHSTHGHGTFVLQSNASGLLNAWYLAFSDHTQSRASLAATENELHDAQQALAEAQKSLQNSLEAADRVLRNAELSSQAALDASQADCAARLKKVEDSYVTLIERYA